MSRMISSDRIPNSYKTTAAKLEFLRPRTHDIDEKTWAVTHGLGEVANPQTDFYVKKSSALEDKQRLANLRGYPAIAIFDKSGSLQRIWVNTELLKTTRPYHNL